MKLLEGSHTGAHLSEQYNEILSNWNIKNSQVHVVLRDNAKNMEKGLRDANLQSYGCFAHSLQLVVRDGVLHQRSVVDLLSICRGIVGHFKRSPLAYGKLHQIQERLSLPQHRLKQDEPTRWNSSLYMLQSIIEQKMAIAAYGSENNILVLNQTQLDLAIKVIKVLEPIEEITKSVSEELACISVIIPLIRALTKTLGQGDDDHGVYRMKAEMLQSIEKRFADVEEEELLVLATMMDPRFKDKFFSGAVNRQNAKKMLLDKCVKIRENDSCYSTAEPPSKRPASDTTTSKLWGCLSEILSEASTISSEDQDIDSISCEVERYLAEPLLDFKVKNPFK